MLASLIPDIERALDDHERTDVAASQSREYTLRHTLATSVGNRGAALHDLALTSNQPADFHRAKAELERALELTTAIGARYAMGSARNDAGCSCEIRRLRRSSMQAMPVSPTSMG